MIWLPLIALAAFYELWIYYLAVMSLKRAKDAGQLSKTGLILGTTVLITGRVLDLICNILLSVILLEWPRELTVTKRLKRHNNATIYEITPDTGIRGRLSVYLGRWRKAVAQWVEPLLDPFDPSGDHI